MKYKTFLRSATSLASMSKARKITQSTGLTIEEAREQCTQYNSSRSPAQLRKGTKMEFERE